MLNFVTTIPAAVFLLGATTTTIQSGSPQTVDDKKVLEEIITDSPINPELGPQFGELLLRPVLFLKPHSSGSRVQAIDLYFSPVEETVDGQAKLYSEQSRSRYRVSVIVPALNPIGTKFKNKTRRIDLGTKSLKLPGGTYILSEVRYAFNFSIRDTAQAGTNFNPATTRSQNSRSYCLTKETYAFDIQNGEAKFLGGVAVNELPSNRAKLKDHFPLSGLDNRLELVSGPASRNLENIVPIDFDLLSFEAEPGLCGARGHLVSALAPARE